VRYTTQTRRHPCVFQIQSTSNPLQKSPALLQKTAPSKRAYRIVLQPRFLPSSTPSFSALNPLISDRHTSTRVVGDSPDQATIQSPPGGPWWTHFIPTAKFTSTRRQTRQSRQAHRSALLPRQVTLSLANTIVSNAVQSYIRFHQPPDPAIA
jgi:hypothetical protein